MLNCVATGSGVDAGSGSGVDAGSDVATGTGVDAGSGGAAGSGAGPSSDLSFVSGELVNVYMDPCDIKCTLISRNKDDDRCR